MSDHDRTYENLKKMRAYQSIIPPAAEESICHTAILKCDFGSEEYVLNLQESHGKYAGDSAQIHVKDGKEAVFGYCNITGEVCCANLSDWFNGNMEDGIFDGKTLRYEAAVQKSSGFMACTKHDGVVIAITSGQTDTIKEQEKYDKKRYFVIISNGSLNIRTKPSMDSDYKDETYKAGDRIWIVWDKEKNDAVKEDGNDGSWLKVYYDDKDEEGWVREKYILPDKRRIFYFDQIKTVKGNFDGEKISKDIKWAIIGGGRFTNNKKVKVKEKYTVAVGPKILNPEYPDDGKLLDEELNGFDRFISVKLKRKENEKRETGNKKGKDIVTITLYVYTLKAHSFNYFPCDHKISKSGNNTGRVGIESGFLQTGIAYPQSSNADPDNVGLGKYVCNKSHFDASVIEFCTTEDKVDDEMMDYIKNYDLISITSNLGGKSNSVICLEGENI